MTALIGALAGINMISGAGMLDFLACQSAEKLVVDAEAIGMAKRLLAGLQVRTDTLATAFFEGINFKGDFLKQKATRDLFSQEQHLPSAIIDRDSVRGWQHAGGLDTFASGRSCERGTCSSAYERPQIAMEHEAELSSRGQAVAAEAGMAQIPELALTSDGQESAPRC